MQTRFLILLPTPTIRKNAESFISSQFSEPIATLTYKNVDRKLIQSLCDAMEAINTDIYDFISVYASFFSGNNLKVTIYTIRNEQNTQSSQADILELKLRDLRHPTYALKALSNGAYICCENPLEVEQIGGIFFWKMIYDNRSFKTFNQKLMDSIYLPVQLAKDGKGLFFEERIASRLFDLELIEQDAKIILIEDKGGWSSIKELTAEVKVHYKVCDKLKVASLLATALIPSPPMKPEYLTEVIEQRSSFLKEVGIRPSVLLAKDGVVYHKKVEPVLTIIKSAKSEQRRRLILQCAEIAAILDNRFMKKVAPLIEIDSFTIAGDYIEISSLEDLDRNPNFISVLGSDGHNVYWCDFTRNPLAFCHHNLEDTNSCWCILRKEFEINESAETYKTYLTFRERDKMSFH